MTRLCVSKKTHWLSLRVCRTSVPLFRGKGGGRGREKRTVKGRGEGGTCHDDKPGLLMMLMMMMMMMMVKMRRMVMTRMMMMMVMMRKRKREVMMLMMMMMRTMMMMMMMIMVVMLMMMLEIQPNPPASAKRVFKDLFMMLMVRMPDPISGWSEIPPPQRGVAVLILVCGGTL